MNFGDEITYALRSAKKKRFNQLEEKRIKQEIELQSYLVNLIEQDKQRKFKQIEDEAIVNNLSEDELVNLHKEANKKCDNYLNELNDMFSQLDIRRKVSLIVGILKSSKYVLYIEYKFSLFNFNCNF